MKKLLVYLISVMIVASLLSACGEMNSTDGYVSSSPAVDVTLVPSASPKASAAPTADVGMATSSPAPSPDNTNGPASPIPTTDASPDATTNAGNSVQ